MELGYKYFFTHPSYSEQWFDLANFYFVFDMTPMVKHIHMLMFINELCAPSATDTSKKVKNIRYVMHHTHIQKRAKQWTVYGANVTVSYH